MTQITKEILTELFLTIPNDTILSVIGDDEKSLSLLRKLPNSVEKWYYLWKKNSDEISILRLLTFAAESDRVGFFFEFRNRINLKNTRLCIEIAAEHGSKDVLNYLTHGGYCNLVAMFAAKGGHRDIVLDRVGKMKENNSCRNILSVIATQAARNGHTTIVKDMLARGANEVDRIAKAAAKGGHSDILYLLGDDSYIMECQAANGVLLPFSVTPPLSTRKLMVTYATKNGHFALIRQMANLFSIDWNTVACLAAKSGYNDILEYALDKLGRDADYNTIAISAAKKGRMRIINSMIQMGANNFNDIAKSGNKRVVLAVIDHVTDFDSLLEAVILRGYKDIANMILDRYQVTIDTDLVKKAIDADLDDLVYRLLPSIDEWDSIAKYAKKVGRTLLAREIEEGFY